MTSLLLAIKLLNWALLGLALLFWAYRMEELTEEILEFLLPFSIGVALGVYAMV